MKEHCVINFADTTGWYPRGQQRLLSSLKEVGFDGDVFGWNSSDLPGCPPHSEAPYAFKPFALQKAHSLGYKRVLWCDASVWAIKPIQPVFDYLAENSHMFFHNTVTGIFTSDRCLAAMGLTREESMKQDMLMGICMGWNLEHEITQEFLKQWLHHAKDGVSFPGRWTNDRLTESQDPRCKGHRHDQSVASILAVRMGMKYIIPHLTYFQYWEPDKMHHSVVLTAQGM